MIPSALRAQAETAGAAVRVCAGGDVSLGTNLDTSWVVKPNKGRRHPIPALPDAAALLAPLHPLVRDADVVLVNVEGAIGEGDAPGKCSPHSRACYAIRQPSAVASALRALNDSATVVGNVANNHAHDAGDDGFAQTLSRLSMAGVRVTGSDTAPTIVTTARGDTVVVLGFSTSSPADVRDLDAVRRLVTRATAIHPRVVVTMHLGAEGPGAQRTRDSMETFLSERRGNPVAFARAAIDAGASLVVGHGPHVVRAIEWRGDALIAYSLGNLVTYGPFSFHPPNDRGALLCAVIGGDGRVASAVLRPTRQRWPGLVSPDRTARAVHLADSLGRLDVPASAPRSFIEAKLLKPVNP